MKRKTAYQLRIEADIKKQVLHTQARISGKLVKKSRKLEAEIFSLKSELALAEKTIKVLEQLCDAKDANYKEIKATNDSMFEEISWYRSLIKDAILGVYTKKEEDNGKLDN